MHGKKRIDTILAAVVWDYKIEPEKFFRIALGKEKGIGYLNQQRALLRILERLDWYEILDLFGVEFIKNTLTPSLIKEIRFAEIRRKYEIIRKVLHGETASFPKWNSETRKRFRSSFLSDRWYGS